MLARANTPVTIKDLVLIGGGHSHAIVLKQFGMHPLEGLRLTLITTDIDTPYSGMIPGYVAGHYSYEQCHIDMGVLAHFASANIINASANGIHRNKNQVLLEGRPPVSYDILSIDIGITPSQDSVPGAAQFTTGVKPIRSFNKKWIQILSEILQSQNDVRVAVVGGGAGGVEITLAMHNRILSDMKSRGGDPSRVHFTLYTRNATLLPNHPPHASAIFSRIFSERGIKVVAGSPVVDVQQHSLSLQNGEEYGYDHCVWCTQGGAAPWLSETGLQLDDSGFIAVDECLQSVNTPNVFASGDIHSSAAHPREKAGVIAVRQGIPLSRNLRLAAMGRPLKRFVPQSKWLSLISTGDRYAVATRGGLVLEGKYLWSMKNYIDNKFMDGLSSFPAMVDPSLASALPPLALASGNEAISLLNAHMRCVGCASKVGSTILARVLARLQIHSREEVILGLDNSDDAALVSLPAGMVGVHTVDFFPALTKDSFTFGKIAAIHALGDCYAMGAQPVSALAIATIPYAMDSKMEEELFQLMSGAVEVLNAAGCSLVGGHSGESQSVGLGFAVTGMADPLRILKKSGMLPGQSLILTKPLGSGALFAAQMRGRAKGRWIQSALNSMLISNQKAMDVLKQHGATACTDVTGFGLAGHLAEMTKSSNVAAAISLSSIPLLDGALDCFQNGIFSSMHPNNLKLLSNITCLPHVSELPLFSIMFDPQTAGGLLASLPANAADECVSDLQGQGFVEATIIGKVTDSSSEVWSIVVDE